MKQLILIFAVVIGFIMIQSCSTDYDILYGNYWVHDMNPNSIVKFTRDGKMIGLFKPESESRDFAIDGTKINIGDKEFNLITLNDTLFSIQFSQNKLTLFNFYRATDKNFFNGKWSAQKVGKSMTIDFKIGEEVSSHDIYNTPHHFKFYIENGKLILNYRDSVKDQELFEYTLDKENLKLTLKNKELGEVIFTRNPPQHQ